jgi:hypothetical protein
MTDNAENKNTENESNDNRREVIVTPTSGVEIVAITFHRENIINECTMNPANDCSNTPLFVNRESPDIASCRFHRNEMTPFNRRSFIKIEDVPSNKPTLGELLFGDEDEEFNEDEFLIED